MVFEGVTEPVGELSTDFDFWLALRCIDPILQVYERVGINSYDIRTFLTGNTLHDWFKNVEETRLSII